MPFPEFSRIILSFQKCLWLFKSIFMPSMNNQYLSFISHRFNSREKERESAVTFLSPLHSPSSLEKVFNFLQEEQAIYLATSPSFPWSKPETNAESSAKAPGTCGVCYLATEIWAVKIRNLHFLMIFKMQCMVFSFLEGRKQNYYGFKCSLLKESQTHGDFYIAIYSGYLCNYDLQVIQQVLSGVQRPQEKVKQISKLKRMLSGSEGCCLWEGAWWHHGRGAEKLLHLLHF